MIVITGAAGFIGSNLVRALNLEGVTNLILVDHFNDTTKAKNIKDVKYEKIIDREEFPQWLEANAHDVDFVFHLGARTDTAELDYSVLEKLNPEYSKTLWTICTEKNIPFLYASSAATYGIGEKGFNDDHSLIHDLKPLNPYGLSKQQFDVFVMEQSSAPPFWVGLKFFNVYGPREAHKGRMASVVLHAFRQIKESGEIELFQSHHHDYNDGEQLRDFIHVDDITNICLFFFKQRKLSGIYNCGTGEARTFNDLAKGIFNTMNLPVKIRYIPIPQDIRSRYQYFTEAEMSKLQSIGYHDPFISLEEGIEKYVGFLRKG
ncbi:MAG: ADP-glyceromanno-heptose 6-epimerase [Bacteroidetes bacterium]|nr:ADP-glyceromanno-heptose 6-epimerase [Bacteroidota bacterium]